MLTVLSALAALLFTALAGHLGEKAARATGSERIAPAVLSAVLTVAATTLAILFTIRMDWWTGDAMIGIFFNFSLLFAVGCVGVVLFTAPYAYACARRIDQEERRRNAEYARISAGL